MKIQRFQLGSLWTNCYVVAGETKDAFVIDPGGPPEEVKSFILENNLKLRKILLTHGHGDHIMGLGEIRSMASEGVAIGSGDSDCLTNSSKNLSSMMGAPSAFEPADAVIADGDVMKMGNMTIRAIATPGHTKGGFCFHVTEGSDALLISGDTLFARSVGRTDLPGGDEDELIRSIEKLASLPDATPVYPGHGPSTTIGDERRLNPFWPR
ncbi:MAG: MBL fold metallo-hydrolase [Synergistaceae bacterium]|jgi:glyoxylase-like metal-dependent hydrolase (beta-lactamase superfamily II)|nr:MBL fold metallo-hydrolase [Synergistaceae bacterium]